MLIRKILIQHNSLESLLQFKFFSAGLLYCAIFNASTWMQHYNTGNSTMTQPGVDRNAFKTSFGPCIMIIYNTFYVNKAEK